jgi:hypothetical protein
MKNCRAPEEVKKSIFKGLDEAISITQSIAQNKVPEKVLQTRFRKTTASNGRQSKLTEKSKTKQYKP